jgi:hypothetical protein
MRRFRQLFQLRYSLGLPTRGSFVKIEIFYDYVPIKELTIDAKAPSSQSWNIFFRGQQFCFTSHHRHAFAEVRKTFNVTDEIFISSLSGASLEKLGESKGKSGADFYATHNKNYFLKTLRASEVEVFSRFVVEYSKHCAANPDTLLPRFYGLYSIQLSSGHNFAEEVFFILMQNLFAGSSAIHARFDLKGSKHGRSAGQQDKQTFQTTGKCASILKDIDFEESSAGITLPDGERSRILSRLHDDVALLKKFLLMDYSLLVGVHNPALGGESGPCVDCIAGPDGKKYYLGIIDILQVYSGSKKAESFLKSIPFDSKEIR